jgi:hypothetical protein
MTITNHKKNYLGSIISRSTCTNGFVLPLLVSCTSDFIRNFKLVPVNEKLFTDFVTTGFVHF